METTIYNFPVKFPWLFLYDEQDYQKKLIVSIVKNIWITKIKHCYYVLIEIQIWASKMRVSM